jgi:oxygen-independent coproporphyrinogen-3 oxidase
MAQLPDGDPAPASGELPAFARDGATERTFHAYLHIPFCSVRCGYCDFNTYTATELQGVEQSGFSKVIEREIDFALGVLNEGGLPARKLETVFFGGGTPTLLSAEQLVELLTTLRQNFGIASGAEVTVEANPDTVNREYFETLARGGFTRVSIGMQSAEPEVLAVLERTHNPQNVALAVAAAKDAGLQTSVDLIYGAPTETLDQWRNSLVEAISLATDHISAYSLIVEPGTKLARQIRSGELPEPDEDLQADKYELADELLVAAGFDWYELSNWSRSAETASRHNVAYWMSQDWWGFGPGAHSHVGGVRWWNQKHPASYAKALAASTSPALARELLDDSVKLEERLLLELRLREGLAIDVLKHHEGFKPESVAALIAEGLVDGVAAMRGRVCLTLSGRLLADLVLRRLIGIS